MRSAIATFEIDRHRLESHEMEDPERDAESPVHAALQETDQRYYALGDRIYHHWAIFVRDKPEAFEG